MAIPFEAAPATVFKESDIAEFGLALQNRQEAKEAQERERYEKMLESVSGPYWAERDTVLAQGGNKLLEMATDPAYYKAPIGSANHNKFIRAKRQYEQLLSMSAANQKYYNEQLKFAQQNPDAEGMQELNAYVGMGLQGEVDIDEAGNFVVAGQPIITSDAMSTPPSLRKREKGVNLEDVWGGTTMGQYTSPDGTIAVPSANEARAFLERKFGGMPDKDKYLKTYIEGKYLKEYGMMPARGYAESIISNAPDELMESFIDEMTKQHLELYKSGGKQSGEGGGGGIGGQFTEKGFVKIEPQFGSNVVPEGSEFKSGLSIKSVPFISNYVAPAKDGEATASAGSGGDKGEIIFVSEVAQDKDGNLYVSGVKKTGDISKIVAVGGGGSVELSPGVRMADLLASQGYQTKTINKFKLEGNDAANFIAAMKIQGVNSVDQFKKAMDDFYGVTAEPTQQVTEVEVEENKKKEGDMTDEEYEQFLKDNGLK